MEQPSSQFVTITCRKNGGRTQLVLHLPPPEDNEIFRGSVEVRSPGCSFQSAFSPSRWHLCDFLKQLQRLHATLDGYAVLGEYECSAIRFEIADRVRGRIGIRGRMLPLNPADVRLTFEGLVVDQSSLPSIVSSLEGVLTQYGLG